ncbi:hypothetical protein [Hymenobacter norwichensis]|uniref:hypothetical protein n=1 Tax=Hymenobacter norwichensis TaxID=223903 RepID=UPI0003B2E4FB|nr:hypothetical protein [Hymenobacter norwichensis]
MATTNEPAEEAPNLPLVQPAGLTDQQMWFLCERYGIAFTPPTARDLQFAGIIKALEDLVDALGHKPKSTT